MYLIDGNGSDGDDDDDCVVSIPTIDWVRFTLVSTEGCLYMGKLLRTGNVNDDDVAAAAVAYFSYHIFA